jgi:hypothetical protein
LILAFGDNLQWVNDLLTNQVTEQVKHRMESWGVEWNIFQRIEVDDVSAVDQIKAMKTDDGISKRLLVVTNSGPVLLQLTKKLLV